MKQTLTYDFKHKCMCEKPLSKNHKTIEFNWCHLYFWVYTIEGSINEFVYIDEFLGSFDMPKIHYSYPKISFHSFQYMTNDKHLYNVYKYVYKYENDDILTLYKFYLYDAEIDYWGWYNNL